MLPEIELVRARTDRVISPEEIARQLPSRDMATIRVSLGRAVNKGQIIKLGYGEYAHPNYQSSVPPPNPKPNKSDWKESHYAALIEVVLNGDVLDKQNHKEEYWLSMFRQIFYLIRDTWNYKQVEEFAQYLKEAMKEASYKGNMLSSSMSTRDLTELITQPNGGIYQ